VAKNDGLKAIMEKMPTETAIQLVDNGSTVGFAINFSEQGFGFGEILIGIDMKTGEPVIDLEAMAPETVARFLRRVVGKPVLEAG